ncbi:MAG: prepilin peptidase [Bacillota bacterium]|nr:prepilin peptidase [Bacillota bacterium]
MWTVDAALAGLALMSALGAIWDLRRGRIPNWLTYPAMALVLALTAAQGTFMTTVIATAIVAAPFAILYLAGAGVGGGDVKMAAALAALASVPGGLSGAVAAIVLGALAGLVQVLAAGLIPKAAVLAAAGGDLSTAAGILRAAGRRGVPYGVALGAGGILAAAVMAFAPGAIHALLGW